MSRMGGKAVLLAVLAVSAAGCQQGGDQNNQAGNQAGTNPSGQQSATSQSGTISQALAKSSDHSSFVSAVKSAGLDATLSGSQPYTVFAPNNAAFQKIAGGGAQAMMQPDRKAELVSVITNHIVPGVVTATDLTTAIQRGGGKAQIATVGGGNLTASQNGGAIILTDAKGGQARVTPSDQAQSNGVVHSLDTVLMPS